MSKEEYKVSICVPIYGVEKYIERCAISLFEQTYTNIEYIFVNDCTKDKSVEILKTVLKKYPEREKQVKIINHEKNKGLGAARNTAVDAVTGEFLMHVDSDDWIDLDCVKLCVEKQLESKADIVNFDFLQHFSYTTKRIEQPNIESIIDLTLEVLKRSVPVMVCGRLIRTKLYKDNNIRVKEGVNMSEDYCVSPKLIFNSQKVIRLQKALYNYNCMNEGSYCYSFSEKKAKEVLSVYDDLILYFSDKNMKYRKAIEESLIRTYIKHRIRACKANNKKYFKETSRKIYSIDKKQIIGLSFPYRFSIKLKNFYILKAYLSISTYIKRKFNK